MAWKWQPSKGAEKAVLILLSIPITAAIILTLAWSTALTDAWGGYSLLSAKGYLILGAIIVTAELFWAIVSLHRR
jgi:hypothetical protein